MSLPFDIDIALQSDTWSNHEAVIYKSVSAILEVLESPRLGELSIALSDDAQIRCLNREYRGKDKPTNVLSFPVPPPAPLLGDIVLAYETVESEAKEKNISFDNHLSHLIIHGFLHLQGYDHINEEDASIMEALEIQALTLLNIDNPYLY
ncbi:putative rRNA maturation factor [Litorimonas taeanensis]|uniref:Endoribonuclease YbeY n=1 Tax=Litorimonas taeanensis TaxID=568099 RepID=A0A420WEU0_9PROT|nr:rRNA maturation RNase YbeY [Litorimonas taeanensis]RKQ69497.1 putative rRNA maturation factor [Litorimonas taeanensis]